MRPPLDLRVYLVTDTRLCGDRGVPATVRAAVDGGATVVQLRDPGAPDAELVRLGRDLVSLLRPTGTPLIVNDRPDLVAEIGADGAHVGQGDVHPLEARRVLGPTAYLGLSCSTAPHVHAAHELPPGTLDYLGLGAVRATTTKPDHPEPLGVDGAATLAALSTLPTVAIGGIDEQLAPALVAGGLDGIAVVSAICAAPKPKNAAARLRAAWREDER